MGDHPQPDKRGQVATAPSTATARWATTRPRAACPATNIAYFEPTTRHNIPEVFWDFLNQQRPGASRTARQSTAQLIDPWFYASGYPISDAYWAA